MTEPEPEYITPDDAAVRLLKSSSSVRRDARNGRLNSTRKSGRVWIRVDERFQELQRNPSAQFPPDADRLPTAGPDSSRGEVPNLVYEELIAEVAALRAQVARLALRVRQLEPHE